MSEADALLDRVKTEGAAVKGQSMSSDALAKAQATLTQQAQADHQQEAAAFTEEIIRWLNQEWNDREFTPEQRIFSVALATINFRNHFPDDKGGKEFFDKVSKTAWEYFAANSP